MFRNSKGICKGIEIIDDKKKKTKKKNESASFYL